MKYRIVQTEGKRQVARVVDLYNLDMIISVGYRAKSRVSGNIDVRGAVL